jgi:transcriptional regulator with XRE-family HTH domain
MSIGARFRQLRQANSLTQEQIGEHCGVSKGMVSQWESDAGIPAAERLLALRQHVKFSIDWLLTGEGDMKPGGAGIFITDRKLVTALQLMEPLPEYGKDAAIKNLTEISELIDQATHPGKATG